MNEFEGWFQCTRCKNMFVNLKYGELPHYHEYVTWVSDGTGNNEPPPDAEKGRMYFCPACAIIDKEINK